MTDVPDYKEKARDARRMIHASPQPDRDTILAACRAAQDAAPDETEREHWQRFIDPLEQGRSIRTKVLAATFITDVPDPELVAAVEEVFDE